MLNYLRLRASLALRLKDPFSVHEQYSLKVPAHVVLEQKIAATPHASLLKFRIDQSLCSGNRIGEYYCLHPQSSPQLAREFYPVSPIDALGFVTFLHRPVAGKMSAALGGATPGAKFVLSKKASLFTYHGRGLFKNTQTGAAKTVDKIGLVCSGAAISTFAQLIHGVHANFDKAGVSLLHVVQGADDLAFAEEILEICAVNGRINVTFVMEGEDKEWPGLRVLTDDTFRDYLPGGEGLVLCAGRPDLRAWCQEQGQKRGVQVWQV